MPRSGNDSALGAAHAFPARVMVSGFIVFKTPSILANAGSRSPCFHRPRLLA